MPTTYRQTYTYYEDGYGDVELLFIISDSFAGLFATTGIKYTNIFGIGQSKKDLDISRGVAAQDELQITCSEASIETADDSSAISFFVDGQDPATPRYVALFINTAALPAVPDVADCEFIGQIIPQYKGQDIFHGDVQWSGAINPLRDWDVKASTLIDVSVDIDVPLVDLINGNDDDNITGIDSAWESANVSDRTGYYKSNEWGATAEARFDGLVNLSALLRKLADNLEQTLLDKGIGTFNIVIADTDFDFMLSPMRFNVQSSFFVPARKLRVLHWGHPSSPAPYDIRANDEHQFGIGDSYVSTSYSPYIHYRIVKPSNDRDKRIGFERYKSFPELIYAVAETLGMWVRFVQTGPTEITITWLPRQSLNNGTQVYIRDAKSGSIDLSLPKVDEATVHKGLSTTYAADSYDRYEKDGASALRETPSFNLNNQDGGVHPPLTASQTLVALVNDYTDILSSMETFYWKYPRWESNRLALLPHNVVMMLGGVRESDDKNTLGATTALYLCVDQNGEHIVGSSEKVFAPIGMIHAAIDSEDKTWTSLCSYVNFLRDRDVGYFETQYDLVIPFINGFSVNSDGSSPSWQNMQLGSRVILEERSTPREFAVVGIERNYKDVTTTIKLHRIGRVAFSPPSSLSTDIPGVNPGDETSPPNNGGSLSDALQTQYVALEDISNGDAVVAISVDNATLKTNIRRATANSKDYHRIIGIAQTDGVTGDQIDVRSSGRVACINYNFTKIGSGVYVRTTTHPTLNVSQDLLVEYDSVDGEGMVATLGICDTTTTFILDLSRQHVYKEALGR